jgi:hypothetical protein
MSIQAVVAFWQKVQKDKRLQERLDPKAGIVPELHADSSLAELEGLNKIAREEGFDTTAEDFRAAEAVTRFWGRVAEDKGLQKKMIGAEGLERSEAVKFVFSTAMQAGFKFTIDQLDAISKAQIQAAGSRLGGELSTEQLESVAGGIIIEGGTQPSTQASALTGKWGAISSLGSFFYPYT